MAATWIADTLRGAGLTVVEHAGWRTRSNGTFAPSAVVWHHDASPPGDSPGVPAYMIRNFRNAGAQLWVSRAGVWHVIAAGQAYHAGKVLPGKPGNRDSWGVETDMTTGESWSPALLESLRRGTAAILARMNRGVDRLEFHKTICSPRGRKVDPDGLDLDVERERVRAIATRVSSAVGGATSRPGAHLPTLTFPSIPEDDMPTAPEVADAVLNYAHPELGGLTIVQALARTRDGVANVPGEVLFGNRVGGRNLIDQHIQTRAEIAGLQAALSALATAQGIDPAQVERAVRDGVAGALADVQTTITLKEQS